LDCEKAIEPSPMRLTEGRQAKKDKNLFDA